ncbi:MAG: molybdopterin-dependent oxidoreductase, partial [Chloroflexota bacterium]|nr:molybdopterin-dependent oxidoreductase [Chloroflexota bacterium]
FGFATENFGSLAQNSLFVAVLLGILAVGYAAGGFAGRLSFGGRFGDDLGGRAAAGLAVAAALLLFTLVVVLPIANLGIFGVASDRTGEILLQLGVTFAVFGVAWALLAGTTTATGGLSGPDTVSRRSVLGQAAWGGGTLALLTGVGGLAWRLIRPHPTTDRATSERIAQEIAATAEARARTPALPAAPTSAPLPSFDAGAQPAAAPGPAQGEAARSAESSTGEGPAGVEPGDDVSGLFARLEAEGRLTPKLTSVGDFYHVSKNISDPTVDGEGWALSIGGLVDRPIELSYEDLVARSTTRKITTLCCISNELNGDLVGTAEWTGLPLADLLTEAGVQAGAVDLKLRAADDYEDSIPVAQGMDPDTLVVVGMNGEPLRPDHGYPARLIVPAIYGMKNVKWLKQIELVDEDFKGYWQTRGWSDPAPYQIWGRIDLPRSGEKLKSGPAVAAGVASAGDRGIRRVEVSLDDGETWADARLEPALNPPFTWVRWVFPFQATTGKHKMLLRATDGTGAVAPERRQPPLPEGATGWPGRTINVAG